MGKYINENSKGQPVPEHGKGKIRFLEADGGMVIPTPEKWVEGLVCVVDNFVFESAAYAFSEKEMEVFKGTKGRDTTWLWYPHAKKVAK